MSLVRASPADRGCNQANEVLSRWVARQAKMRARSSPKSSPSKLIARTRNRQLAAREHIFKRNFSFSWLRTLLGLTSLVLVLSDVPRSGTGVSSLEGVYPLLQPDEMLTFGTAWNYSVFASTKESALSGKSSARVWSYKFDSTSVVWRAFGSFLSVAHFPECFSYENQCPNKTFGSDVAFKMIDSLVDAVANTRKTNRAGPIGITIRSESEFIDRLHQYILPRTFTTMNWRTNQALHYSHETLEGMDPSNICFPTKGKSVQTPRFCQELWINFQRSCAPTDTKGRSVGLLYVHTMRRLRDVKARFPNLVIDLTLLESLEDLQTCRGGLSSVGYRRSDVSTIIRARNCSGKEENSTCDTLYVNDYRYEAGFLLSDVIQWYRLVAALRVIGQSYFWVRAVGLLLSCYFVLGVSKSDKKALSWTRFSNACHLFLKVPKQCVVYGSPLPVVCYALAHLLDASFMYEVFKSRYSTQAGILQVDLRSFVSYAVVQMRNVWIYALIWQIAMTIITSRWLTRSSRLHNGIVGVPAFFLSTISSTTLFAQYRSTSFRSTKILEIKDLPGNVGLGWVANNYQYNSAHRGQGSMLLGGVAIDLKFLLCCVLLLVVAWIIRLMWFRIKQRDLQESFWYFLAPTPVPYSAGVLWPAASVCVRWKSGFFCIQDGYKCLRQQQQARVIHEHLPRKSRLLQWSRFDAVVVPIDPQLSLQKSRIEKLQTHLRAISLSLSSRRGTYRFIQHRMQCLHRRSDDVEANVAFMNAVVMSDPLVYLQVTLGEDYSTQLAYYQSFWSPHRIVLLPMGVVGSHNEYTAGLKLLHRVSASELTWSELVQCG